MTHTRLQDVVPSGIILAKNPLTSSLDELKIYNENTIYLNDGNEFQIRLFNPLRERIGVQIGFNGEITSSYLVLNPGEDATIDRFIETQKKMLFETYQYDSNNSAAVNAVAKNGIVSIKFFKEKKEQIYFNSTFNGVFGSQMRGSYNSGNHTNDIDLSNINSTTNTLNLHDVNVFNTTSLNNSTISTSTLNCIDTSSTSMDNLVFNSETEINTKSYQPKSRMKETGRISKGGQSAQKFKKIEVQFEYFSFYEINYNLKPISGKEDDIEIREYCTQCSTRIRKKTWIYCPKCGNKLN